MGSVEMGLRVKQLRRILRLTQREFAKRIGMTNVALCYIETGTNTMSSLTRTSILKEFNVNPKWLDTGKGEMFIEQSENERLAQFVGDVLRSANDDARKRILHALSRIPTYQWGYVAEILDTFIKNYK